MGRPPIGKTAMSGAERVRRHRLKQRTDRPVTKRSHGDAVAPLKARIRELESENTRLKAELAEAQARTRALDSGYNVALGDMLRIMKPDKRPQRERALRRAVKPTPPDTPAVRREEHRAAELRAAVRNAERAVDRAWHKAEKPRQKVPLEDKKREMDAAMRAVRVAVREDVRARWAAEDAAAAMIKVGLPPHISRLESEGRQQSRPNPRPSQRPRLPAPGQGSKGKR